MPKATTTAKKTEENNNNDKDKIDYLEKKIQELLKLTETLQQNQTPNTVESKIEKTELKDDRPVKIVSLTYGVFNLLNGIEAQAKTFGKYGETKIIPCSKLRDYLNYDFTYSHMLQGSFYIADAALIKEYGLEDLYEKILSKEVIDSILTYSDIDLKTILEVVSETQKENICTMLAHKIYKKEINDPYKIEVIGKACNIDINEKVRQIMATEENEKEEE